MATKRVDFKKKTAAARKVTNHPKPLVRNHLLWVALVVFVTCAAYSPLFKGQFINYDDGLYILENPFIRNPNIEHLRALFSATYQNQYSPIAMLIMAIEFKLFGGSPQALKAISLALHLVNVLLVFELIRQVFNRSDYAIITAGLFALHTLQVESVAWLAASMKICAYSLFFLSSCLAYVRYLQGKKQAWFGLSLFLFVLSCLSKEQAVVLPAVLLAIDYSCGRRLRNRTVFWEKVPFLMIAMLFAAITLLLGNKMQNPEMLHYYTAAQRFIFASFSVVAYLLKLILPVNLSAYYTYPLRDVIPSYYYATPLVVLLMLGAFYIGWRKQRRIVVFSVVFFAVNIFLPLMSLVLSVRDVMMADRYIYLPAIGFFLLVAYGIVEGVASRPQLRVAVWTGLLAYGLLLAALTWQRVQIWENSITLFSDVISKGKLSSGQSDPFLSIPFNNRGVARKQLGDIEGALADLNQAINLNPSDVNPLLNRADVHFDAKDFAAAIPDYEKVLGKDPRNAKAYSNRGAAYAAQNKLGLALGDFNRAIELDPMLAPAYANRALLYSTTKRFAEELADTDRYLQLRPDDADMINSRALVLVEMNRMTEAEAEFNHAIELSPETGAFYLNRSTFYLRTGRKQQALQDAQRAQSLGINVPSQYLDGLR